MRRAELAACAVVIASAAAAPASAAQRFAMSVAAGSLGEWVDWFNHRRLLEPIGNIPPAEAEELFYAAADNIDTAA